LDNDLLRFSFLEFFILQAISDMEMTQMIFYTSIPQNGLLLRNISKTGCQFAGICYNICVATFWQQKISNP